MIVPAASWRLAKAVKLMPPARCCLPARPPGALIVAVPVSLRRAGDPGGLHPGGTPSLHPRGRTMPAPRELQANRGAP